MVIIPIDRRLKFLHHLSLSPEKYAHHSADTQDCQAAGRSNYIHDRKTISAGCRIVVKAEKQELIDRRTNAAFRTRDQSQPQIPGRVLNAVEVVGDSTFWC